MSLYRLLRSNKETGPHTQEDLLAMGFKPYDLIWVEGKSAGWRYPSELPEFKTVAPAIEEQPYDRFYKKPAVTTVVAKETPAQPIYAAATSTAIASEVAPVPATPMYQRPVYTPAPATGRHIHVTLPSGNTINVTTINNNKDTVPQKPAPAFLEERPSFTEAIAKPYHTNVDETVVPLREHTSNIKKEIAPYTVSPSQSNSNFSWTMILGLFVGIATLVGLGIMIGLSMNREDKTLVANQSLPEKKQPVVTAPVTTQPEETNPVANNDQQQPPVQPTVNQLVNNNNTVKKDVPTQNAAIKEQGTTPVTPNNKTLPEENKHTVSDVTTAETGTALKRNAIILPAVNLEKQVNIKTNQYKVGAFGGITGLECTLVNESKFALDVVEVEVQYIQANDKVFKTERLAFRDVGAGTQLTITAPTSSRGIKVTSKITRVSPKESGLSKI